MRIGGRQLPLILLVGFVAAACAHLFFLEPWGHDTWYHLQRLLDIEGQMTHGVMHAHFAENAAQGKGLPVWIYYSQWIYWPPIFLKFLGASTLVSLKIVYCVLIVVCCSGCYRLLRLNSDADPAVAGTLLFMTSNYVIGEVFQRSAYAEFCSVAFLPFLLFCLHRTLVRPERGIMAVLVLLASVMILAHPLSFMNAGLALLAYTVYVAIRCKVPVRRLLQLFLLFIAALGLTAFYWFPAVVETRYVLGAEGVPTPLSETFLTIPRYFKFYSILSLGFVLTVCALAATVGLLLRRREPDSATANRTSWPLALGALVYVFLTLKVSAPLYASIPFLASNLWVWRVLFPLTLLVVILLVSNLRAFPMPFRSRPLINGIAILAVLQSTAFVLFYTVSDVSIRRLDIEEIRGELAKEVLRLEGFGIDEYLPQPRLLPTPAVECQSVRTVSPGVPAGRSFSFDPDGGHDCFHVPWYWNVRYAAFTDGRQIPVFADTGGEILLAPEDRSGPVTLRFATPVYVTLSGWVSATTALLLLVALAWMRTSGGSGETRSRIR